MQHKKQTDVRFAKRLGFIQRLRFSNLGFNYRDTSTAREQSEADEGNCGKIFPIFCVMTLTFADVKEF